MEEKGGGTGERGRDGERKVSFSKSFFKKHYILKKYLCIYMTAACGIFDLHGGMQTLNCCM